MEKMPLFKIISGNFINPVTDKKAELLKNYSFVLKKERLGYKFFEKGRSVDILKKYEHKNSVEYADYSNDIILPGLYDIHFHWVQDDVSLKGKANLLHWLKIYTWPHEAEFKNKSYSKKWPNFFQRNFYQLERLVGPFIVLFIRIQ